NAANVSYTQSTFHDLCDALDRTLSPGASDILVEPELLAIRESVRHRLTEVAPQSPIATGQNGGDGLCSMCYLACRVLKPSVVVETGVAHGVTSAYILAALQRNACGHLYSIDRPPLALHSDDFVGVCIPDALKAGHTLIRGDARAKLPAVLNALGEVDMFVHDSDHSYRHMKFELGLARRHLRVPGVVISDDVDYNTAFHEFVSDEKPAASLVVVRGDAAGGCSGVGVFT
ncbi:MAG TPA: class I SAM-dependent methyltransferase, partial [Stellaceae bacterium]|nr:class I SAM-dependent methyltransferase [Stellaceae bacterium]